MLRHGVGEKHTEKQKRWGVGRVAPRGGARKPAEPVSVLRPLWIGVFTD